MPHKPRMLTAEEVREIERSGADSYEVANLIYTLRETQQLARTTAGTLMKQHDCTARYGDIGCSTCDAIAALRAILPKEKL